MRRRKTPELMSFTPEAIRQELRQEAQALGLPENITDLVIERVIAKVAQWLDGRPAVTEADLNRKLALELQKYNADLAYVYQNRDKII